MSFMSGLYSVLQAQADVDRTRATAADTQALAQQRLQNVIMQGQQMQRQQNTITALQGAFQGWDPSPPQFEPGAEDSAAVAARKAAMRADWQANQAAKAASVIAKNSGDPKEIDKWYDDATNARFRANQMRREALQEQKFETQQVASVAQGVKDTDSLNQAMSQIAAINSDTAKMLATQLDRDPYTGAFVFGPKSQTAMQTTAVQGRTAEQQAALDLKMQQQQDKEAQTRIRDANEKRQERLTDAQVEELRSRAKAHGQPKVTAPKPLPELRAPTNVEVGQAQDAILARDEFKSSGFDKSIGAFASDVAARAKKIARDAKVAGDEMSLDDARDQAIEELKGFVTTRQVGEKSLFGFKYDSGETKNTYTKGGASKKANAAAGLPQISSQEEYDKLKSGDKYLWNGKELIKK